MHFTLLTIGFIAAFLLIYLIVHVVDFIALPRFKFRSAEKEANKHSQIQKLNR